MSDSTSSDRDAGLAFLLVVLAFGALVVPAVSDRALRADLIAAWTGAAGMIAAIALMARRGGVQSSRQVRLAWSLFMVWALVAAVFSGRMWAALAGDPTNRLGWMTLAAMTAMAAAASAVPEATHRLLRQYAWVVVAVESVYAMVYFVSTGDTIRGGTLANSSDLGVAFVLLLPWVVPPDSGALPAERWLRFGTAGLAVLTLGAIQSRAALVVITLWGLWVIARGWRAPKRYKLATAGLLAAAAVAGASMLPGSFFASDGPLPLGGRLAAWSQALRAVADRPLFGWGPDAYWPAAAAVRTPEVAAAGHSLLLGPSASDPHNFVVWIVVSTGIVGLVLWAWFAVEVGRAWWSRRSEAAVRAAAGSVACCLALGLVARLDLHVLPLLALVIGSSLDPMGGSNERREALAAGQRFIRSACTVALCLGSVLLALHALSTVPYDVASEQRSPTIADGADRMSALWSLDPQLAYLSSLHAGWAAVADPMAGWQQVDLRALDRAVELDSRNPFYALERARAVRFYLGTADEVDAAFAEAFLRYPAYPLARAEYAQYLAETGRYGEAQDQLDIIAEIDDPDDARIAAIEAAEAAIAEGEQ